MGGPMAQNLAKAGHRVQVWNRSADKAHAIANDRISVLQNWSDLPVLKRLVFIMLSTGAVCDAVLFDQDLASKLAPGSIVVVMSSIPVETAKGQAEKLAKLGVSYLDAPVSGGEKGAINASLTVMAGGQAETIERARPYIETMGRLTHVGPVGSGQLAKLANQLIVGVTIGAVSEALLLVEAGGGDAAAVREALSGGFADSTILRQHGERMVEKNFTPGAHCHVQLKDLSTAEALSEGFQVNTPLLKRTRELYEDLCEGDLRDLDHSALYLFLRDQPSA